MLKRQLVKTCPVVKASRAVMRVPADLVREWAGLLMAEKDCEWLALLTGRREEDGHVVVVEGMIIPSDQERSTALVKLPEGTEPDGVVGVIHSHHGMMARFSGIDEKTLNDRFWSSIVISYQLDSTDDPERWWIGFDYEAVAQVKLPCGNLGRVEMELRVDEGPRGLFEVKSPKRGATTLQDLPIHNLGDCPSHAPRQVDDWSVKWGMGCGLELDGTYPIRGVLGQTCERRAELPPEKGKSGWKETPMTVEKQSILTPEEELELAILGEKPFHAMTDEEFDRWCELEDRELASEPVKVVDKRGQGERWVEEDEAWEAYRRTYFELQREEN